MILPRSGPTLTKVPVASLKSSAMRAVKAGCRDAGHRVAPLHGVAGAEETFVIKRLARGLRLRQ